MQIRKMYTMCRAYLVSGTTLLKQWIAPSFCAGCKTYEIPEHTPLCIHCEARTDPIPSIVISITPTRTITLYAAGAYRFPLKSLILAKQYHDISACNAIAHLIWHKTPIAQYEFDLIVPVPLHWTRYAHRGYNQAAEIAAQLGKKMNIPVVELIKRTRPTALQLTLSKEARIANVTDAFVLADEIYKTMYAHKRILLVDDLYTTGATLNAVAKQCLVLRPALLKAVVGARVI